MKKQFAVGSIKQFIDINGLAEDAIIERKEYVATSIEISPDEERTFIANVSTIDSDNDGDIVLPDGGDFSRFVKNGVLIWSHDYARPNVGKALQVATTPTSVQMKCQFAPTPFANELWELVKFGSLKTCSLGFIANQSVRAGTTDFNNLVQAKQLVVKPNTKRIVTNWTLVENSLCNIPSNADALIMAVSQKSINVTAEQLKELGMDVVVPEVVEVKSSSDLDTASPVGEAPTQMATTELPTAVDTAGTTPLTVTQTTEVPVEAPVTAPSYIICAGTHTEVKFQDWYDFFSKTNPITLAYIDNVGYPTDPGNIQCCLASPNKFDTIRCMVDAFADGVSACLGVKERQVSLQSIRFDAVKWSMAKANEWVTANKYTGDMVPNDAPQQPEKPLDCTDKTIPAVEIKVLRVGDFQLSDEEHQKILKGILQEQKELRKGKIF